MTEHDPASAGSGPGSSNKDLWDFSEFGEQPAGASFLPEDRPQASSVGGSPAASYGDAGSYGDQPMAAVAGFGSPAGRSSGLSVAGPPLNWLAVSAAAAVLGLLLAALLGALPPLAVIGWLLAGPVAIGALAVYISVDTRRRASPIYVAPNWLTAAFYTCLVVCLAGVVVAAIRIALWVGRW